MRSQTILRENAIIFFHFLMLSLISWLLYVKYILYLYLAITPTPPCTPINVGNSSTLLSISSPSAINYLCYCYEWTAPSTGLVSLTFQLRNDPDYWFLDDVSIYNGGTQMLINGNFESGNISPWVVTSPYGPCQHGGSLGQVCTLFPHAGSYDCCDGCNTVPDQVTQSLTVTAGQTYVISFWLGTRALGSGISALVTISWTGEINLTITD